MENKNEKTLVWLKVIAVLIVLFFVSDVFFVFLYIKNISQNKTHPTKDTVYIVVDSVSKKSNTIKIQNNKINQINLGDVINKQSK